MELPQTVQLDRFAANEIGRLVALIEAIDVDLAERGVANRRGDARSMVDIRLRASARLDRWLTQFGMTPASRAQLVGRLDHDDSLADDLRPSPKARSALREVDDVEIDRELDSLLIADVVRGLIAEALGEPIDSRLVPERCAQRFPGAFAFLKRALERVSRDRSDDVHR
jgi:hypothetical protein